MPENLRIPKSILMIEEEKNSQWFFKKAVAALEQNIKFYEAEFPLEAAVLAEKIKPDLIITEIFSSTWNDDDSFTPDYFGPALIKTLQKNSPRSKIIVCSTQPDGQFGDWYVGEFDVSAYFKKPYGLEDLIRKSFELLKLPFDLNRN